MNTYKEEWEAVGATLGTSSPVIRRLKAFWDAPTAAESDYFVALGHLSRNAAGPTAARHAVQVAAQRLQSTGLRNARAAIDIEAGRCIEALRALRGYHTDAESELPFPALVSGREALEGLRTLLRLVRLMEFSVASALGDDFNELLRIADAAAVEIDATVERNGLLTSLAAADVSRLATPSYAHLVSLAQLHPDDWWNALAVLRKRRAALSRLGEAFEDDFDDLAHWVPKLRSVEWSNVKEVERFTEELPKRIDGSYRPRNAKSPPVERVLRILWGVVGAHLDVLSKRSSRGEIARLLARGVTLTMTLYDRVLGLARPAARVPNDLQRLGWASHAWRTARLLQYQEGEIVINAFRRHSWWRSAGSRPLDFPEAVAAGCVAAAWYAGQTGYRDEGKEWLTRAENLTRAAGLSSKKLARRLTTIANGCTELAGLYLQVPEQPDISLELANHAVALADECSASTSARQADFDIATRVRAMTVRAAACDQKGEFLLAMDERNAALRQLDAAPATTETSYGFMEMKQELHLAMGDVDSAEKVMLQYLAHAKPEVAAAVAYNRATMLLDYGYQEAGLDALEDLAARRSRSQWVSRARALLKSARPTISTDREMWSLEVAAQTSFREARRLANTDEALEQIKRALHDNEKLLKRNARDLVGLTRKAQLLIQRGADADLKKASDLLSKLRNDDPYVLFCRGQLAYRRRDFVTAASWLREAYELAPRAQTAALLANALIRSQQLPAALEAVDAHDSVEDDAPLLDTRGVVLATMGKHLEAWRSFQEACTALASGRTSVTSASTIEGPQRRTIVLCRRLASLATHVARVEPSAIETFLRRDADIAHLFITACISRLAFDPALRTVILGAAQLPALRKPVAQYAMGACVYEDTLGRPQEIEPIVSSVWKSLDLRHNRYLIAELLAGGKSSYRASIRTAFDGDATTTRQNALRWLKVKDSRWQDISDHVARTHRSATYYTDTGRLVDKHPDLWASVEALVEQVRLQIPCVRMASLRRWELVDVVARVSEPSLESGADEYLQALVTTAHRIGPVSAVVNAIDLDLPGAPPCLVDVTPQTLALARRFVGPPTAYSRYDSEDTALGLQIVFDGGHWPPPIMGLLRDERLLPRDDTRSIVVPIEATPDAALIGSN